MKILTFKEYLTEAFKDIGKLSKDELKKGQRLNPNDKDNFKEVDARVFFKVISTLKKNDLESDMPKGLDSLHVYRLNEYKNMKCYLGKNNSSGYCIAKDNDLVSVFSTQKSSGNAIVQDALRNGAKTLDCFAKDVNGKISGALYSLYSKNGFKINKDLNVGKVGEPYSIQNGVSRFVDDNGVVQPNREEVVIFMKI